MKNMSRRGMKNMSRRGMRNMSRRGKRSRIIISSRRNMED